MTDDFAKWWSADGQYLDPDTSDVPWFDKRRGLAEAAFDAGKAAALEEAQAVRAGWDRTELLAVSEYLLMQADIDTPEADEPECTDLCGSRVCDQIGCVVSKYRRVLGDQP